MARSSTSVTPRNVFVGLFVLALALALFFIPEIVRFYGSVSGKTTKSISPRVSVVEPSRSIKVNNDDPLAKVLGKIETGAFDTKSRLGGPDNSANRPSFWSRFFGGSKAVAAGDTFERAKLLNQIISENGISWNTLQRGEITAAVRGAIRAVKDLAHDLPSGIIGSGRRTQTSMDKYIGALTRFSQGDLRQYSAEEALRFIGQLDMDVTRSLLVDKASRDLYDRWLSLGIEPLLKFSGALDFKVRRTPPFRGDIVLTTVQLQDIVRPQKGNAQPYRVRSGVNIRGIVVGNDARKIELRRNNIVIQSKDLSIAKRGVVARPFNFQYIESTGENLTNGVYLIRLIDKRGASVWKAYNFIPRAYQFSGKKGGRFDIPVVKDVDLRTGRADRRLDTFFLVAARGAGTTVRKENFENGFSTFGHDATGFVKF